MSDKNKISLEDRGWEQMSSVLDRELPQGKSKRRAILWFFVTGALVLVLAGFMALLVNSAFFLTGKQTVKEQKTASLITQDIEVNETQESEAVIQNTTRLNTANRKAIATIAHEASKSEQKLSENNLDTKQINRSVPPFLKPTDIVQPYKRGYTEPKNVTDANSINNNNNKALSTIKETKEILSGSILIASNDFLEIKKQSKIDVHELTAPQNTATELETPRTRNNLAYSKLPQVNTIPKTAEMVSSEMLMTDVGQQLSTAKPNGIDKNNNYYVFTGGQVGLNPQNGLGYQVGIGSKFGNRNVNFFVELGFANMSYRNSNSESIVVEFTPDETNTSSVEFSDLDNTVLQDVVAQNRISENSVLNNINGVFINAGFDKSVLGRLNVHAGLTYSKLLNIENKEISFTSVDGTFQRELDIYNVSKTALFDNGEFRKYEISTALGIGYQVSSRINVSADYRFGLTDMFRNNSFIESDLSIPNGMGELESQQSYKSIFRKNIELKIDYSF